MFSIPTLFAALGLVLLKQTLPVAGHGFIQSVTINGYDWPGFDEPHWTKPSGSAVMVTDYLEPLYDVNAREIACGKNAQAAQGIATVSPNDQIQWHWVTHSYKPWTHNEGTKRSWIASCNGDCSSVDPTTLHWVELTSDFTGPQTWNGVWPVKIIADGHPWIDKVPPAPNGDYLIRNELTALHYSWQPYGYSDGSGHGWGIEMYPTCMAIRITNSPGTYDMTMATSFPGAYTVNQKGHYNPDLWKDPNSVGIAETNKFPRSQASPAAPVTTTTTTTTVVSSGTIAQAQLPSSTAQTCNRRTRQKRGLRHHPMGKRVNRR